MNTDSVAVEVPKTPGFKMIRTLGIIALLSGLIVVLVFEWTKPIIAENQRIAIEAAVFKVVPGASSRVDFVLSEKGLFASGLEGAEGEQIYAAFNDQGKLKGIALQASAQGYQDVIKLLYGYDPDCSCIRGIKVLKMTETPGLGDKIAFDPVFLKNFEALDAKVGTDGSGLAHAIVTVKSGSKQYPWEIDAISGATVSSVAVGKALNQSMQRMAPLIQQYVTEMMHQGPAVKEGQGNE